MGKKSKKTKRRERKRAAKNQQPEREPDGPSPAPNVVQEDAGRPADSDGGADGPTKQDQDEFGRPRNWYLIVQTFVGLALVAFTFGQVIVGYWQWDATDKQWDAMMEQIAQTERTFQLDQRAWLSIAPPVIETFEADEPIVGKHNVTNSGKTPGTILKHASDITYLPTNFDPVDLTAQVAGLLSHYGHAPQPVLMGAVVAPGKENSYLLNIFDATTGKEFEEFKKENRAALFFEFVSYLDVFGERRRSWSLFIYDRSTGKCERLPDYDHMD